MIEKAEWIETMGLKLGKNGIAHQMCRTLVITHELRSNSQNQKAVENAEWLGIMGPERRQDVVFFIVQYNPVNIDMLRHIALPRPVRRTKPLLQYSNRPKTTLTTLRLRNE